MKHWKKVKDGCVYNNNGIALIGNHNDNVISIGEDDGEIKFTEECDGCYSISMSKQDAIKALEEAIEWIKGDQNV